MKRVFVVGVPRSGTTLCQTLLMSSGQLLACTESHFLDRLPQRKGTAAGILFFIAYLRLRRWAKSNGFSKRPAVFFDRESAISAYISLLDEEADARGNTGWVDKTPAHLRAVEALRAQQASLVFVFCLREGHACVDSLTRVLTSWRAFPDEQDRAYAVARWLFDSALCQLRFARGDSFELVYEDLVADPGATVGALFAFVGLPPPPIDGRIDLARHAGCVVEEGEHWKRNNVVNDSIVRKPQSEVHTKTLDTLRSLVDELR